MNLSRAFRSTKTRINLATLVIASTSLTRAFSTESVASTCSNTNIIKNEDTMLATQQPPSIIKDEDTMLATQQPPSIKIIPEDKLYKSEPNPMWFGNPSNPRFDDAWTNKNWLKSRFHFNFAEYSSGHNVDFGVLRVLNDDLVQPKRGFGAHPHRDMEIITYIVEGNLTHQDSTGSKETLGRGSIQFMTAGTGIQHSEFNHENKPLRFVQVWITPRARGLPANYGSYDASSQTLSTTLNKLQHLGSDAKNAAATTPVKLNQDVDCHAAELELGESVSISVPKGRQAYLLCIEGSIQLGNDNDDKKKRTLHRHDAAEIVGSSSDNETIEIKSTAVEDTENGKLAHFLMFTMKEAPGSGRRDIACLECER